VNTIEVTDEMIQQELEDMERELKAAKKKKLIEQIVTVVDNVPYAGDDKSQARMTSVLAIANWQHNKSIGAVLRGVAEDQNTDDVTAAMLVGLANIFDVLFRKVYKDIEIQWKAADNAFHTTNADNVGNALYKTMQTVGSVLQTIEQEDLL